MGVGEVTVAGVGNGAGVGVEVGVSVGVEVGVRVGFGVGVRGGFDTMLDWPTDCVTNGCKWAGACIVTNKRPFWHIIWELVKATPPMKVIPSAVQRSANRATRKNVKTPTRRAGDEVATLQVSSIINSTFTNPPPKSSSTSCTVYPPCSSKKHSEARLSDVRSIGLDSWLKVPIITSRPSKGAIFSRPCTSTMTRVRLA